MSKPIHLPQHVWETLQATAAHLDDLPLGTVLCAAVRAFRCQPFEVRAWLVHEFWCDGGCSQPTSARTSGRRPEAMDHFAGWSASWRPSCVSRALADVCVKPFSRHQTLVALLTWFAEQPRPTRVGMILDYLEENCSDLAAARLAGE
jgi:hypothetical protein